MEFRSIHTLETAENVRIKVELAGLANRVFAFALDGMIMLGLLGGVMILTAILTATRSSQELGRTVMPLGIFVVFFGYHLFQEWLWNGKTLGKAALRIRVVRNNGQPIGFWESFGRNLLRVVDVYTSGVGLLVMMFNRSEKRCGDFVAGTIVINDQPVTRPGQPTLFPASPSVETPAIDSAGEMAGLRLSDEEAALLRAFQRRRQRFLKPSRDVLSKAFQRYFSQRWHQPVDSEETLDQLLEQTHPEA
jgi:uncharacterized RDD family membrane protein YckC